MTAAPLVETLVDRCRPGRSEPALIWGRDQITYGALAELTARARGLLMQAPLSAEGCVCFPARKSPTSIAVIIALLTMRRPVLLPSRDLGTVTLEALVRRAGCGSILTEEALDLTGVTPAPDADVGEPDPEAIAFLMTTSGSTGVPKVVPLSIGAIDRFTDWAAEQFEIRAGTTVLSHAPLNFDLCLLDVWTTLKAGGRVVLLDQDKAANPRYLLERLASSDVRVVQGVSMLYRLLLAVTEGTPQRLEGVEHVIFTGDVLPPRVQARLPHLFPNARLYNVYGCTETNDSFIYEVQPGMTETPIPIGRPLPGVSALVVDANGRTIEGPGTGELLVSTPFQTRGYRGDADPPDRFVTRPDGRTYFMTGDSVRQDSDGLFTLIGRNDFQVKVRGVRINLQEIEAVILLHDHVVEAVVVALPDELAGSRLAAMVRRTGVDDLNGLGLREHCARHLPRAAIPSTIRVVDTPLPRTSTGKFERREIALALTKGTRDG